MSSNTPDKIGLLNGVKIVECSVLLSASVTTMLSDLGAEVVKIEQPSGDPVRKAVPPFVGNTTLMDLHVNRGKRRVSLDLRIGADVDAFLNLAKEADALIEAMRPGLFDRWGLTREVLWKANPRLVILRLSAFGITGPYRDLPTHGTAYDAWAGLLPIDASADNDPRCRDYVPIGITAGPIVGALALLSGIVDARVRDRGCELDVAHADVAAWFGWQRLEEERLAKSRAAESTNSPTQFGKSIGHRVYRTLDSKLVLLMAPELAAWKRFCDAASRQDLQSALPSEHGGNSTLVAGVEALFLSRTAREWMTLAQQRSLPIVPVNRLHELADDPQFQQRAEWLPASKYGADLLATPIRVNGNVPVRPR
jgi:crotonobetainyl-CoA:carnitine CoA-transferase CaiB-like acyl-CoA transferase